MMKLRIIVVVCLILNIGTLLAQPATTFTVNTTSLGVGLPADVTGSLDRMIENAIVSAETGSGYSVTIYLNTTGLISLGGGNLPTLNHDKGKITITKAAGATSVQGIQNSGNGFYYTGEGGDLEISELTIQSCLNGVYYNRQNAPTIANETNLAVQNNTFEYARVRLTGSTEGFSDVVIDNNIFTLTGTVGWFRAIYIDYNNATSYNYGLDDINIINNTFTYTTPNTSGTVLLILPVWIVNLETNTKNEADISISNNIMTGWEYGLYIIRPNDSWIINGNTFNSNRFNAIKLSTVWSQYPTSLTGYDFDFIENGVNDNEIFESLISYDIEGMDEVTIQNFNHIEGEVFVSSSIPVTITQSLIKYGTVGYSKPISLSGSNGNISSPNPTGLTVNGNDLTVDYDLSGYTSSNGQFTVEFFLANGFSLLQYLGSETYTTAPSGSYVKTFTNVIGIGTRVGMTITAEGTGANTKLGTSEVAFIDLPPCPKCNSFLPETGTDYWMSAWIKVDHPSQVLTYEEVVQANSPSVELEFLGNTTTSTYFYPTGDIIDGWQRVVGKFSVPSGTAGIGVELHADQTYDTYFDDLRIHPFNGSMKSYVYDGETFWLSSELDDNNYATFYEYDNEGGLVRIKKETSRGIVTIQETRSNSVKQDN